MSIHDDIHQGTRENARKILENRHGDEDIEELSKYISQIEIKLRDADVLAMMVDVSIRRGRLDERGLIADARLNYGTPWDYKFARRDFLMSYEEVPEIKEILGKRE